jgi:hypothetical protein
MGPSKGRQEDFRYQVPKPTHHDGKWKTQVSRNVKVQLLSCHRKGRERRFACEIRM